MKKMGFWCCLAFILVVVGGLNLGSIGFFDFNFVYALFGHAMVAKFIYALIGVAAVYMVVGVFRCSHSCNSK